MTNPEYIPFTGELDATPEYEPFTGKLDGEEKDGAFVRGLKRAKQSATITTQLATGDTAGTANTIRDAEIYNRQNPSSKESDELSAAWEKGDGITGGIAAVGQEFAKDWRESKGFVSGLRETGKNVNALREGVVSQLGNSVAPMVGLAAGATAGAAAGTAVPVVGNIAGGLAGGWAGAAAGNTLVEGGGQLQDALHKANIDPMDTVAVEKFVAENGDKILGQSAIKGGIIGAVDTATAGIAGRLLNVPARAAVNRALVDMGVDVADKIAVKEAMKNSAAEISSRLASDTAYQASRTGAENIARNAGAAALDPAGEFTGEYVGQGAATGDWNTKNAALEALSSVGQSGAMFAGQKGYQALTNPFRNGKTGEAAPQSNTPITDAAQATGAFPQLPAPSITVNADGTAETTEDRNARIAARAAGDIADVTPIPNTPEYQDVRGFAPAARQTQALEAPTITVDGNGQALTAQDRNNRLSDRLSGGVTDVTPIQRAPEVIPPSRAMGLNPANGSLSGAAAMAVDSGASVFGSISQQGALNGQQTQEAQQTGEGQSQGGGATGGAAPKTRAVKTRTGEIVLVNESDFTSGAKSLRTFTADGKPRAARLDAANIAPPPPKVVLQNRDRSTSASIQQMNDIVAQPDFLKAGTSSTMDRGAPMVFGDLPSKLIVGRTQQVADDSGKRIPTNYAVVEADDLLASNNADGTTNNEYAEGVPGKLRAVAGNGRVAGLQEAWNRGTTGGYAADLAQEAESLGIDPQALAGFSRPVLVRVMDEADVTADIGDRSNIQSNLQLSVLERAGNDVRRMDLRDMEFNDKGNPTSDTMRQFMAAMPTQERGDMLDKQGLPTLQLIDRIKAAAFKQAYMSDSLVELATQSVNDDAKRILNALTMAAGDMVQLDGTGEFDIRQAVADAAGLAVNAAKKGEKLSDYLRTVQIDESPEAIAVARFFEQNSGSANQIADGLRAWANLAKSQVEAARANADQGSMFGETPTLSRNQLFERLSDENITDIEREQLIAQQERAKSIEQSADAGSAERAGDADSAPDSEGSSEEIETESFALDQQTPQELQALEEEQAALQQELEQEQRDAEAADRAKQTRDEVTRRSEAAADNFQLGQSAEDSLSGQGDIFSSAQPAKTQTSKYTLPIAGEDRFWRDEDGRESENPNFTPTARQQVVIDATDRAIKNGVVGLESIKNAVANDLGVSEEERNKSTQSNASFGTDVYSAFSFINSRLGADEETKIKGQLNLKAGNKLGVMVFSDQKQANSVEVVAIDSQSGVVKLKAKRGTSSVQFDTDFISIKSAIDLAKERDKRTDGFDEFVAAKANGGRKAISANFAIGDTIIYRGEQGKLLGFSFGKARVQIDGATKPTLAAKDDIVLFERGSQSIGSSAQDDIFAAPQETTTQTEQAAPVETANPQNLKDAITAVREKKSKAKGNTTKKADAESNTAAIDKTNDALLYHATVKRLAAAYKKEEYKGSIGDYATLRAELEARAANKEDPKGRLAQDVLDHFDDVLANAAQRAEQNAIASTTDKEFSEEEAASKDGKNLPASKGNERPAKWRSDKIHATIVAKSLGIKIPKNTNTADLVRLIDAQDAKASGKDVAQEPAKAEAAAPVAPVEEAKPESVEAAKPKNLKEGLAAARAKRAEGVIEIATLEAENAVKRAEDRLTRLKAGLAEFENKNASKALLKEERQQIQRQEEEIANLKKIAAGITTQNDADGYSYQIDTHNGHMVTFIKPANMAGFRTWSEDKEGAQEKIEAAKQLHKNSEHLSKRWVGERGAVTDVRLHSFSSRADGTGTYHITYQDGFSFIVDADKFQKKMEEDIFAGSPDGKAEKAKKEAQREVDRKEDEEIKALKEKRLKNDADKEAVVKAAIDEWLDTTDKTPMQRGLLQKQLLAKVLYKEAATSPITKAEFIQHLAKNNGHTEQEEVNKVVEKTGRAWSVLNNAQQKEHTRKVQEGGKKTINYVNGFTVTKAEYDYANYLINKSEGASSQDTEAANTTAQDEQRTDKQADSGFEYPTQSENTSDALYTAQKAAVDFLNGKAKIDDLIKVASQALRDGVDISQIYGAFMRTQSFTMGHGEQAVRAVSPEMNQAVDILSDKKITDKKAIQQVAALNLPKTQLEAAIDVAGNWAFSDEQVKEMVGKNLPKTDANPNTRPAKWRSDKIHATLTAKSLGIKIPKNSNTVELVKLIDAHDAKVKAKDAAQTPAEGKEEVLRVGIMPNTAEAVTVKDGVVFIGKHEALDFDSGEPVTLPKGSTREQVAKALMDSGALSGKQKLFGLGEQSDAVMFSRKDKNGKSLVTLHNLSEENLIHADEVGGLPVPSIGITKVDSPFEGFGDITLIATTSVIDPSNGTPVYDRDAWTARFPEFNFKRPKTKDADALYSKLKNSQEFGRNFASNVWEDLRNTRITSPAKLKEHFTRYKEARALYAKDALGKEIAIPMRQIPMRDEVSQAKSLANYWKTHGESVKQARKSGAAFYNSKEFKEFSEAVDAAISESFADDPLKQTRWQSQARERSFGENGLLFPASTEKFISDLSNIGQKEVDQDALARAIDKAVKPNDPSYLVWVNSLVDPIFDAPTITLRGREVPATLDNIVDAMTIGGTQGAEKSMTYGAGKTAAMLGKRFKSIAEIQAARDQVVTPASEVEGKNATDLVLKSYRDAAIPFFTQKDWRGAIDTWAGLDSSMEALAKAGKAGGTDSAIRSALLKAGFSGVDSEVVRLAGEAIDALRNAATDYFEAKPQRAVKINEFKGAVAPKGTSKEALAVLEKNGVAVELYGKGVGARDAAIKKLAKRLDKESGDILFSKAFGDADQANKSQENTRRLESTQRLVGKLTSKWVEVPEIVIAQNMADNAIPSEVREHDAKMKSQGVSGEPRGFIYKGKVYLLSDQLATGQEVAETLFHEVLGHFGLRGVFGSSLTKVLNQVALMRRKDVIAKAREYGLFDSKAIEGITATAASDAQIYTAMSQRHKEEAAEEVLAEMAQANPELGLVKQAIAAIRNWLRQNVAVFGNLQLTDADIIQGYLLPARGFVTRSKETGAQSLERAMAAFSRTAGDQTETPEFKKWFGDSKVVDADGKPLVVYHGTKKSFNKIDMKKGSQGVFWVTSDKSAIERGEVGAQGSGQIMELYASIKNPAGWDEYDKFSTGELISRGYDGVILPEKEGDFVAIVFESNQIKSATGNNGDFDGTNPDIRYSRNNDAEFAAEVANTLAEQDETFRYPVSQADTLDGVMTEAMPGAQFMGDATREDERQETGADTRSMFKSPNDKPFYVYEKGREVWIDVSRLSEGDRGSAIYHAVANYAYNTGKRFVGDPAGLSEDAVVRRTAAMLSSALRFGTTRHFEAAPEQLKGVPEKGISALEWGGKDYENVQSLIRTFVETLQAQFPAIKNYRYDFATSQFTAKDGRPVGRERFLRGASSSAGSASRAGEASLRRGVFLQSLMASESSQRPAILEQFFRRSAQLAKTGQLDNLFFASNPNTTKPSNKKTDSSTSTPTDRAVMDMVREGKATDDVLKLILGTSRSRFNKQLARLLLKTGALPKLEMTADLGSSKGFKRMAKYSHKNNVISMAEAASGRAEQIFLHELVHAATMTALNNKSLSSVQMRVLFNSVRKQGGAAGKYGMTNVAEFVSEAFTNPDFQKALKSMSAPAQSNLKSAWDYFVRILKSILGLPNDSIDALSAALEIGVSLMREDMSLRKRGAQGKGKDAAFEESDSDNYFAEAEEGAGTWQAPESTKYDKYTYLLQDKQIDSKRVINAILDTGKQIADALDVYLQETLFHGRAAKRVKDFAEQEERPLIELLRDKGIELSEMEEYLHARHAPEANKVLSERNPNQSMIDEGRKQSANEIKQLQAEVDKSPTDLDIRKKLAEAEAEAAKWRNAKPYQGKEEDRLALSGMSNEEAAAVMDSLDATKRKNLQAAAKMVDRIIAKTRETIVDYGLESQDTVDAWGRSWDNYVPLMREQLDDVVMGGMGTGQGFSVKGKETKGRTGSTKKVVDILANINMQRERAIVRGEKNRVATALLGLVKDNPNKDFWHIAEPGEIPSTQVIDKKTGLVTTQIDPLFKSRDNALIAKVNGVEKVIIFNENDERATRMAVALKNMDAANLEGLLGSVASATRYLAAVNTQYNPIFGIVNMVRDFQEAAINIQATPLAGKQKQVIGNAPKAIWQIGMEIRAQRNGKQTGSEYGSLWEEFQEQGGQTGYRDMFNNSAERSKQLQNLLKPDAWADTKAGRFFTVNGALKVPLEILRKTALRPMLDLLSDYNEAIENGVRLSAYKAALDIGMSKPRAAELAKNLTVNFNRKGQVAQQVGALYAFFNASVQGTARMGQTIFDMEPGKPKTIRLSSLGKKIVGGGVLLGSVQALLLAASGFGDDEPPEFIRERNLVIPNPLSEKGYISIPMPLGYHVLTNLGRIPTEYALSGFKGGSKRAISLLDVMSDIYNPIGGSGLSMQTLAPSVLDPFAALAENKDFTGRAIAKQSFNKVTPGHALGRDTSTLLAQGMSKAINYATGGTEYTRGELSPTPDQIDYLIGQVTGGVGREASKASQTTQALATGQDLPLHKIPLVGRFYGDADSPSAKQSAYYNLMDDVRRHSAEVKGLRNDGKATEAIEYMAENPQATLHIAANAAERQVKKLRDRMDDLKEQNAPRESIKEVETQMTEVMQRFAALVQSKKKP